MKRLIAVLVSSTTVLSAFALFGASGASAATKLKCFGQSPAICTIGSGNSALLDSTTGGYAGVYPANATTRAPVAGFSASFDYRCQPSNVDTITCVGGGAPRWSIPIDTNGDRKVDGYAFLDAANCGFTGTVSTTLSSCPVFEGFGSFNTYANWAAFAAANPTYAVAGISFVISDVATAFPMIIYDPTVTKK
jgi:hypothetical protein